LGELRPRRPRRNCSVRWRTLVEAEGLDNNDAAELMGTFVEAA
jgi:hypothetical protein